MPKFACDNVNLFKGFWENRKRTRLARGQVDIAWASLKVSYAALDANSNRDFEAVQNVVLAAY